MLLINHGFAERILISAVYSFTVACSFLPLIVRNFLAPTLSVSSTGNGDEWDGWVAVLQAVGGAAVAGAAVALAG